MSIKNINNFMSMMNIETKRGEDKQKKTIEYNIYYKSLEPIEIDLKRFNLIFSPYFSYKENIFEWKNAKINEKIKIDLEYNFNEKLENIQTDIRHLEKFFNLVLGKSPIIGIEAKLKSGKPWDNVEIITPEIVEEKEKNEKMSIIILFLN